MNDAMSPTLHVTFGYSAAGSLKLALKTLGRSDRVVPLADDLQLGPINPVDIRVRDQWMNEEFGFEPQPESWAESEKLWAEASSPDVHPIAWLSRHDAGEYSGFLELLWRRAEAPTSLVDVTDLELRRPDGNKSSERCLSSGFVGDWQIATDRMFDRAKEVSGAERLRYLGDWQRLKAENAALRIIDAERLVSAPITHFDELVMSCTSDDWSSLGRVIGSALHQSETGNDPFICARVWALVDSGRLEMKGEGTSYQDTWVRRSSAT